MEEASPGRRPDVRDTGALRRGEVGLALVLPPLMRHAGLPFHRFGWAWGAWKTAVSHARAADT